MWIQKYINDTVEEEESDKNKTHTRNETDTMYYVEKPCKEVYNESEVDP